MSLSRFQGGNMTVLVTGGAGYIGSHTALVLLQAGYRVVSLDNYNNSSPESLRRVTELADSHGSNIEVVQGDIRNSGQLSALFAEHSFEGVIHFAGLKAVGESTADPLRYFDNNVSGTIALLQACQNAEVRRIVFSSSATVYGEPAAVPVQENAALRPTSPYGRSKQMVEQILEDLASSDKEWRIAILRYFNPVGAHESGRIGEDPKGVPSNLVPILSQVAVGRIDHLNIYGDDWPTPDGTGLRDYVHIMDVAEAHVAAYRFISQNAGAITMNLGTGMGVSVLEMVSAFAQCSGKEIPYRVAPRRPGDVATCYAAITTAETVLGWKARRSITTMCTDAWRWQKQNPHGYKHDP